VRDGLYKVDFHTVHGTGSGVIHAIGGTPRGGNSAFAFIGSYKGNGETILAKVSTQRHNDDPSFRPLFGTMGSPSSSREQSAATWSTSRAPRCSCQASISRPC
jgi:hypothetical protein